MSSTFDPPLSAVYLKRFWEHRRGRGRYGYARNDPCNVIDPLLIAGKGYNPPPRPPPYPPLAPPPPP